MTKAQLEAVIDELVGIVDSWNGAAADEDRGRANDCLCLCLYDDGSGSLGRRNRYPGPDGPVDEIEDWHTFGSVDELVEVLMKGEGVELEEGP